MTNLDRHKSLIKSYTKQWKKLYPHNDLSNSTELPPLSEKEKTIEMFINIVDRSVKKKNFPILFRYSNADDRNIDNLINQQLFLNTANNMNDPFEGNVFERENIANNSEALQGEMYMKCFSITQYNLLMWAHYADDHKGICVSYDFNEAGKDIYIHLFPVFYNKLRFSAKNINNVPLNKFIYLRKSPEWKYENEWRLLFAEDEIDNQLIKVNCVKTVYLGARMDKDKKNSIKKRVDEIAMKYPNNKIEVSEIGLCEDEFKLRVLSECEFKSPTQDNLSY